ncbi:immunoglobulin-like fold-containing [Desulfonema limicola]|uniref:Immunoglobulin-like fold-containing n=1 Tax=Desulfonema limicola TaxID=45656 RepID=A0A975GEB2_9BACT|nr:hypothetical protein [Desulfonema limicola]QTA78056.1 immunoglobulin-like fold-containing [Desulfonema limicola]
MKKTIIFQKVIILVCFTAIWFPMTGIGGQWEWMNPLPQGNTIKAVWGSSGSDVFAVGLRGTILHYNGSVWSEMNSGTSNDLLGIWGSSASDVFAVGYIGTILHYDGDTWSEMSSDNSNGLLGIWGSSASDVFVVDNYGNILHYNGNTWSEMSSGNTNRLSGIWGSSASDVFAVGDSGTILHYDGNTWSEMSSDMTSQLNGVWGSSSSDIFAVGNSETILHYDGNTWSEMNSGTSNWLLGIWGSSNSDVFAVGIYGTILHYDGNIWSKMSSGNTNGLLSVWGSSNSDVFAVGGYGTILHYDGNTLSEISSVNTYNLKDIWGHSSSDVFAVGDYDIDDYGILHYDGNTWSEIHYGTKKVLYSVWGSSASDVFAVGLETILHYDGNIWSENSINLKIVYAVWGSSSSDVFAVGNDWFYHGIILHYDGNTWSEMSSGNTNGLSSVWGSSASNVFAVGSNGTILHYDGNTWSEMSSGTTDHLSDIWGSSASNVFVVGSNGTILHYDGNTWFKMSSGTTDHLLDVWGSSASNIFIVGYRGFNYDGTILHYDGDTWSEMIFGTNPLYGVWGSSESDVFAVGENGTILHYTPVKITPRIIQIKEPDTESVFNIKLTGSPTHDVIINLHATNPGECTVSPSSVTLNQINWETGVNVTVKAEDDFIRDGNQETQILFDPIISEDLLYKGKRIQSVQVTVEDNESDIWIDSLSPVYCTSGQAVTVQIIGNGFIPGTTRIFISSYPDGTNETEITANAVIKSSTNISVNIPAQSTGHYNLKVSNNAQFFELPNTLTFADAVSVEQQKQKKAVIAAGGSSGENNLKLAALKCITKAYTSLIVQGYTDDSIFLISPAGLDLNNDGIEDIAADRSPSAANLYYALNYWAKALDDPDDPNDTPPQYAASELLVFMTGPANSNIFYIEKDGNSGTAVSAQTLDIWLDNLQENMPGRLIFIYDACMSGSFIPILTPPAGKNRIIITGSMGNQRAWFLNDGEISFSYHFFETIKNTGKIFKSFDTALNFMKTLQIPQIDVNGSGDPRMRRSETEEIAVGIENETASYSIPEIGAVSASPETLSGGITSSTLKAWNIKTENGIENVWASAITPPEVYESRNKPGLYLPTCELHDFNKDGIYENNYEEFTCKGDYTIKFYAKDKNGSESLPLSTTVSQTEGIIENHDIIYDINGDDFVDLKDVVIILKILTGQDTSILIRDNAYAEMFDIDEDNRIGLSEALNLLQMISRM